MCHRVAEVDGNLKESRLQAAKEPAGHEIRFEAVTTTTLSCDFSFTPALRKTAVFELPSVGTDESRGDRPVIREQDGSASSCPYLAEGGCIPGAEVHATHDATQLQWIGVPPCGTDDQECPHQRHPTRRSFGGYPPASELLAEDARLYQSRNSQPHKPQRGLLS